MSNAHAWVYKTRTWKALRFIQLLKEPLCRFCKQTGTDTAATVVDHKKAHRGNRRLAFDPDNLQSLCKPCHDKFAQIRDRGGIIPGSDDKGYPLDPNHSWNRT